MDEPDTHRRLSTWQAWALVVASMVGTGVFTSSGFLLELLGTPGRVLAIWAAGGVVALAGAAVYAELGVRLPRVGGEYVYLSRAFHPMAGFLSGWVALVVGFAAPMAAAAVAFGRYLAALWPEVPPVGAGLVLIAVVSLLHGTDVRRAGRLQTVATGLNVAAMLAFIVLGAMALRDRGAPTPTTVAPPAPASAYAVGLVLVSYSYFGWNAAAYVAGEVREPARALPRALLAGCALVTTLYLALNAIVVYGVPAAELRGQVEVAHLAGRAFWGPETASALTALVCLVLAASVSALCMTGPRVYLAMAQDGLFFRVFARRNARGAPSAGVALQGGLAAIMTLTTSFDALLLYIGFTLTLAAAAAVAAAVVLRRRTPLERGYAALGWPWSPLLFFAASIWMSVYAVLQRPRESLGGLVTLLAGAAMYRVWRRSGTALE